MKSSIPLSSVLAVLAFVSCSDSLRAATITYQAGANGYVGTQDTAVRGATPDRNDGAVTSVSVDSADGGGQNHVLIRFDNMFGPGTDQTAPGSVIIAARLTIRVTDNGSANTTMNRMLVPWTEATTWNTFDPVGLDGVTADDVEAAMTPDATFSVTGTAPYFWVISIAPATLQAWLDGTAANNGWAILPGGTDGVDFDTSESTTVANRPALTVVYGLPGQPVLKTFVPTPVGFFAQIDDSTPPAGVFNPVSLNVTLDGNAVIPQLAKAGITTTLSYSNAGPFAVNSSHTVIISFEDSGTPPKRQTEANTYVIAPYTAVPAAYALTAADTSKSGFKARVYQMPVPRGPAALLFNVGINAVPQGERQLARGYTDPDTGQPYANTADLSAAINGFFDETGVLNWGETAPTAAGLFTADINPPVTCWAWCSAHARRTGTRPSTFTSRPMGSIPSACPGGRVPPHPTWNSTSWTCLRRRGRLSTT
jgi:hypothetical protein